MHETSAFCAAGNYDKRKVTIQNPISIPLALHFDVASRHMKFQKKPLIHASMIRKFMKIVLALNSYHIYQIKVDALS